MRFFKKYKRILLLLMATILIVWGIVVSSKPREELTAPEKAIGYTIMPFQKAFNFVRYQIHETYLYFAEIGADKENKAALSKRVFALEDEVRKLKELKQENERLRQILDLKNNYTGYELTNARVIGRSPENWNSLIFIDKGTNDGIKLDNAVISINNGLLGRIIEAGPNWSKVLLITDPGSSVSSFVERTRDMTVTRGDALAIKEGYLKLMYVLPNSEITEGDAIVTSGYGGIFPKDIMIGKVVSLNKDDSKLGSMLQDSGELTKSALVEPKANLRNIEEVVVIRPASH